MASLDSLTVDLYAASHETGMALVPTQAEQGCGGVKNRFLLLEYLLIAGSGSSRTVQAFEAREFSDITAIIALTEKEAGVFFRFVGGRVDYEGFLAKNPSSLIWTKDIYYRYEGKRAAMIWTLTHRFSSDESSEGHEPHRFRFARACGLEGSRRDSEWRQFDAFVVRPNATGSTLVRATWSDRHVRRPENGKASAFLRSGLRRRDQPARCPPTPMEVLVTFGCPPINIY